MKPYLHSKASAHKFGGIPEDYLELHNFLDESKAHHADMRHRALLHNTWGIFLAERIFGTNITNSAGKLVSVRDVLEQHIIEDLGRIPAVTEYLQGMPFYHWLGGSKQIKNSNQSKTKEIILD